MSLETADGEVFDAIVYGEREPQRDRPLEELERVLVSARVHRNAPAST